MVQEPEYMTMAVWARAREWFLHRNKRNLSGEIHDIGRLYFSTITYPSREIPLWDVGWTGETDEPYRIGACRVIRVPLTKCGVVIGWWGSPGAEEDTLAFAIGGRHMKAEEANTQFNHTSGDVRWH